MADYTGFTNGSKTVKPPKYTGYRAPPPPKGATSQGNLYVGPAMRTPPPVGANEQGNLYAPPPNLLDTPEMAAFLAGLNQPQPEEDDPLTALLNSLGAGGGGGGSGYDLNGELGNIAQAYQTHLDELTRQRDAGTGEIDAAKGAANTTLNARSADQANVSKGINDSILANYSKAHDNLATEGGALAAELQKFGVDPSKIAPTITQSQGYLGQAREAQSALSNRMQQIASDALASRNSNVDLVAQGAQGTLSNNYAQTKMQMDLARQQQEAAARQQAAAAARASAGSATDPLDQATKMLKLQGLYQDVTGTGPTSSADFLKQNGEYDLESLDPNSAAYAAAVKGGDPDSLLKNYYTSDQFLGTKDDGVTPITQQVFDDQGYLSAYQQLQAARNAQLVKAKGGATKAKQTLYSLGFKGR